MTEAGPIETKYFADKQAADTERTYQLQIEALERELEIERRLKTVSYERWSVAIQQRDEMAEELHEAKKLVESQELMLIAYRGIERRIMLAEAVCVEVEQDITIVNYAIAQALHQWISFGKPKS